MKLEFNYNDGGRSNYFKGMTGDCVCRAISIGTGMDYKTVYDMINEKAKHEKITKRKKSKSNARTGVYKRNFKEILKELGWTWVPLMTIGSGCTNHLAQGEIPMDKTIICSLSHHLTCVVNGVLNDTYDCSREGTRCVYGYWYKD